MIDRLIVQRIQTRPLSGAALRQDRDKSRGDRQSSDVFLEAHTAGPEQVLLDLDATDDPLYGKQEGRFFHGYYGHYCYRDKCA